MKNTNIDIVYMNNGCKIIFNFVIRSQIKEYSQYCDSSNGKFQVKQSTKNMHKLIIKNWKNNQEKLKNFIVDAAKKNKNVRIVIGHV